MIISRRSRQFIATILVGVTNKCVTHPFLKWPPLSEALSPFLGWTFNPPEADATAPQDDFPRGHLWWEDWRLFSCF